jgi:hypothetical protein
LILNLQSLPIASPTFSKHIVGPVLVQLQQRVLEALPVLLLNNQLRRAYHMEATAQHKRKQAAESQAECANRKAMGEIKESRPQPSRANSAARSAVISSRRNMTGHDTKNRFT